MQFVGTVTEAQLSVVTPQHESESRLRSLFADTFQSVFKELNRATKYFVIVNTAVPKRSQTDTMQGSNCDYGGSKGLKMGVSRSQ